MRSRILITNGTRTIDLVWIQHTGTDIYWGSTGFDGKHSYHASGKVHTTQDGERSGESWQAPLQEISGIHHLTTHSFRTEIIDVAADRFIYSGKKSDAVMIIDTRSLSQGETVHAGIGLMEPYRLDALSPLIKAQNAVGLRCRQILTATDITPWVYVLVHVGELLDPNLPESGSND